MSDNTEEKIEVKELKNTIGFLENDIEELEKLKADVEVHMQVVLDSITALNELADPDRVKKMFPLAVACYNSEKEFVSILLSHVESRISEKKT